MIDLDEISTRVAPSRCACGALLDVATEVRGRKSLPCPGDLSICTDCGRVSAFNDALLLEPVNVATLPREVRDKLQRYRASILQKRPG
jgi:hypothetical protein